MRSADHTFNGTNVRAVRVQAMVEWQRGVWTKSRSISNGDDLLFTGRVYKSRRTDIEATQIYTRSGYGHVPNFLSLLLSRENTL